MAPFTDRKVKGENLKFAGIQNYSILDIRKHVNQMAIIATAVPVTH